jgi:soluble lytic murein transglycosylase-like protein
MKKIQHRLRSIYSHGSRRDYLLILLGAVLATLVFGIIRLIDNAQVPLRPASAHITISWLPSTVRRWETPIDQMAKKYNIDPNFIAIIMTMESGGYSKAQSNANAVGLMQITPLTAQDISTKFLKTPVTRYNLFDPTTSIEFGTAYLAYLRDQFGTAHQGPDWNATVELVAAGYNGGPGAANSLEQGKGLLDPQTVIYSRDAFNMWRERHASDSPTFDRWKERGGSNLLNLALTEK